MNDHNQRIPISSNFLDDKMVRLNPWIGQFKYPLANANIRKSTFLYGQLYHEYLIFFCIISIISNGNMRDSYSMDQKSQSSPFFCILILCRMTLLFTNYGQSLILLCKRNGNWFEYIKLYLLPFFDPNLGM